MPKILLAEGEPEAIRLLTSYIMNFNQECEIVPITDSSRVQRLAEDAGSALLLADADFLGDCEGAVKRLRERCPDVKVILYASIGKSEQLQQCMQYDILDYMYKPVKQSELLRCLQRALDYFKAQDRRRIEDAQITAAYNAEREAYGELFIRELLNGAVDGEKAIADGLRYFRSILDPDFCVFRIEIDRYYETVEGMSQDERMLLAFKIKRLTEEILRGNSFRLIAEDLSSVTVILSGRIAATRVLEECQKIKQSIFDRLEVRVSVGIGSGCSRLSEISRSYQEARAALVYRPAYGYNSCLPISVAEPFNSSKDYPADAEERLVACAVMGAYEGCAAELKTLAAALEKSPTAAQIVMSIMTSINRRAAERGIDVHFAELFDPEAYAAFTPADAYEYLRGIIRKICGFVSDAQRKADETLVQRARDYIKEHYYENASSAKLALMLGTTPEYFERVFIESEGAGVYEFTARLRLMEAKTLIRKTMMDDELIAIKVGYDDIKQFRNEFKEYENMSVHEYRLRTNSAG